MKREETGMTNKNQGPAEQYINEDEERYRLAVEAAALGTWDYFPPSGKMVLNESARALFGATSGTPLNYSVFLQLIYPDDREQVDRTIRKAIIPSPFNILNCEFRTIALKNNEPQWVRLKGKVYFNEKGQVYRCIGVITDISEKKAAERAGSLQKITADLERSNHNLEEFAFMASHDLQEPLRKIRIFTQLLRDRLHEQLSQTDRVYLEKINVAAVRMGSLIRSLLDYSRLSGKKAPFVMTDMNEMIKTVISDLEIMISRQHATIIADSLPVIEAIPIQIIQLFTNLVSNAIKFACENISPVIRIAARSLSKKEIATFTALDPQLEYTEIIVADNGIGFDPAFAEQIFGVFQRLHVQQQYEGTGIGLSICRKIATNHNGLIFAESKKDQGATFHVILPVKQQ